MNEALYIACTTLFFVAAPVLLAIRLVSPRRMPWWLLVILVGALGWVLSNLTVHFYFQHLDDLLAAYGGIDGRLRT